MDSETLKHLATIPKNAKGEEIQVAIKKFTTDTQAFTLLDIRQFYNDGHGTMQGTRKGITIKLSLVDALVEALLKGKREALANGWLEDQHTRKAA